MQSSDSRSSNNPAWRLEDDRFSFATGTDSTVSGLRGHGRTLDRLLSAGGSSIDSVLSKAGEALGRGPTALVVRMLTGIAPEHWTPEKCRVCPGQHARARRQLLSQPQTTFTDVLDYLLHFTCVRCRRAHAEVARFNEDFQKGCKKLVQLTHTGHPNNRILALQYAVALIYLHDALRDLFTKLGLVDIVEDAIKTAPLWSDHSVELLDALTMTQLCLRDNPIQNSIQALEASQLSFLENHEEAAPSGWLVTSAAGSDFLDGLVDPSTRTISAFWLCLAPPTLAALQQAKSPPQLLIEWTQKNNQISNLIFLHACSLLDPWFSATSVIASQADDKAQHPTSYYADTVFAWKWVSLSSSGLREGDHDSAGKLVRMQMQVLGRCQSPTTPPLNDPHLEMR